MKVMAAWLRLELRRRWRSLTVLALLVAFATTVVLGSIAGARRGESATDRLLERTLPATATVLPNQPGFDWNKIRALPEVAAVGTFPVSEFRADGLPGVPGETLGFPLADSESLRTIERPVVLSGRMLDKSRVDEVVVTARFPETFHKGIGNTITLRLATPQEIDAASEGGDLQTHGPVIKARIVGIVRSGWFSDPVGGKGHLQISPAVFATYPKNILGTKGEVPINALVRLKGGEVLTTAVCVPDQPPGRLELDAHERIVVGRTRIGGASWLSVWLPKLLAGHPDGTLIRVAPAAYRGELLGLLVVRRPPKAPPFTDEDDRVLIELARQVGLAMHNVNLDSALQASLDQLRRRNEELQASRLRIVTAADAARRAIEHDLHDGAQQHLVALSVKLGLARQLLDADPGDGAVPGLLDELRADVQDTIAAVRELAHGIYPPLLRNQGLSTALAAVARRSALRCTVSVELPSRYPEEIEAAVYFCCLEAIQNAGKHAGPAASLAVQVSADGEVLRFSVTDNGAGFASGSHSPAGQGRVNMADRVGAVGGRLRIESAPGEGCSVLGDIPVGAIP